MAGATAPDPTSCRCRASSSIGLLELTLTDEQWACVSAPMEPFVIVAGAGTGKTTR